MKNTYIQHAIFAETWEHRGGMLKPMSIVDQDGGPDEGAYPRWDRAGWEKRLQDMRERNRPTRNGAFGDKIVYHQNFELRSREIEVTVTEWALVPARESSETE